MAARNFKEFLIDTLEARMEIVLAMEVENKGVLARASLIKTKREVELLYLPNEIVERLGGPGIPAFVILDGTYKGDVVVATLSKGKMKEEAARLFQDLIAHEIGHLERGMISWASPKDIKTPRDIGEVYYKEEQFINEEFAPLLYEVYEKAGFENLVEDCIIGGILGLALNPKYEARIREIVADTAAWEKFPNARAVAEKYLS